MIGDLGSVSDKLGFLSTWEFNVLCSTVKATGDRAKASRSVTRELDGFELGGPSGLSGGRADLSMVLVSVAGLRSGLGGGAEGLARGW